MTLITVGQKVWYWPTKRDKEKAEMTQFSDAPLDATVVAVHSDRLVNLVIFDAIGLVSRRVDIRLIQNDEICPFDRGYAEIRPIEIIQAHIKEINNVKCNTI